MASITPNSNVRKTALVVDDSKLARYVLKEMLIEQGIKTEVAESAEEALGLLSSWRPDVIFMDHMMPGMDGLQAVKAIKNDPQTATIPILMYTSKDEAVYVSQARALGAVGVLPKKLKPVQLEKVLAQLSLIKTKSAAGQQNKQTPASTGEPTASAPAAAIPATVTTDKSQSASSAETNKRPDKSQLTQASNTLEELALRASEDQEKDSMRLLFRQLFIEQRSGIKQDQSQLLDQLQVQLLPEFFAGHQKISRGQRRIFIGLGLLLLLILLPLYGLLELDHQSQADSDMQLSQQQILTEQLQQQLLLEQLQQQINNLQQPNSAASDLAPLDTQLLQWVINQKSQQPYQQPINSAHTYGYINRLLTQLDERNFSGNLQIRFHAGAFCEQHSSNGQLTLADDQAAVIDCINPLASYGRYQAESSDFENYLANLQQDYPAINLSFEFMGTETTLQNYPAPETVENAKAWNKIAAINNRLEIRLDADTLDDYVQAR